MDLHLLSKWGNPTEIFFSFLTSRDAGDQIAKTIQE